ncbi:MAG: selenocysteine-specific translation elongation factor [Candidatus Cloacimonadota bacterium]|nr:MAG: selenocysteine-specific translation elongation factor [Candidatus Cloacimonadota bacterium]
MGKIMGTAGHVDHGKTELIKALTGIDTDRLIEEKERGLTIDLGFAYIDLEKSGRVGIIDVPGHERFMKNMLAGVGGMDIVILVIAGNESVMPQTKEHFEIMRLLDVKDMVVGISKIDIVDEETLLLVKEEIKDLLEHSRYKGVPVVEFSSITGEGIDRMKQVLDERVDAIEERYSDNQFTRLAIDRCFYLKGIGSVITGTLLSGSITEGDEIIILPSGYRTRARQIQEHNVKRERVRAGERVAINLPGIEKHSVERGFVITKEGELKPTTRVLISVAQAGAMNIIKDMTRVRVYLGSGEYLGRLELIGKRKISSGETFLSYLVLEKNIVAVRKDRFILRFYSPMKLLGGGVVLDAFPRIKRRFSKETVHEAEELVLASDEDSLLFFLHGGHQSKEVLRERLQVPTDEFEALCKILLNDKKIVALSGELFSSENLIMVKKDIVARVDTFHKKNPLKKGIDKEALKNALCLERNTLDAVLAILEGIKVDMNYVKRSGFMPRSDQKTVRRREQILETLRQNLFCPEKLEVDDLIRNLITEGEIIKLKGKMYFHREAIQKAKMLIQSAIKKKGPMSAGELKDLLKTTRKFAIPLLEYLDSIKFTIRKGDLRGLV